MGGKPPCYYSGVYFMVNNENIIILDKEVSIVIACKSRKMYSEMGYKAKVGDTIVIPIEDLSKKSRIKVLVQCPICGKSREKDYRDIWTCGHTICNSCATTKFCSKNNKCVVCERKAVRIYDGKYYCGKHYEHMEKHGKILERTCKDRNEIEILGEIVRVFTYNKSGDICNSFIIDIEGYNKIKNIKWSDSINGIVGSVEGGKSVRLNNFLCNRGNMRYVIHINGDNYDFRKSNLTPSNNKATIKTELEAKNISNVEIIHNVKIEKIDKNKYRLLNVRKYVKVNPTEKEDILIEKDEETGCWNCIERTTDRGGYTVVYEIGTGKGVKLHRRVLEMKIGRKLEAWEMARHTCDNPRCCNPNHLIEGTAQDNVNDMFSRGRSYWQKNPKENKVESKRKNIKGETVHTTKEDVEFIYKKVVGENISQRQIIDNYGYSRGVVNSIINKKTWSHITDKIDKEIEDKRLKDIVDMVGIVNNLSRGGIYTNREIAFLSDTNRETVRRIINKTYNASCMDNVDYKNLKPVIYVCDIKHDTIVDGIGFRSSVYCSFCHHFCFNCHNQSTWNIKTGKAMDIDSIYDELMSNEETDVTFTGGDPMFQAKAFAILAKNIKENSNKTIWVYSGFKFEECLEDKNKLSLLKYCDVLVDGKYIDSEKDSGLLFRGSKSQRLIDVKKSLAAGSAIEYIFD